MAFVIAEPCINVKDTACVVACTVDCIHPRKNEADFAAAAPLYIDPVECIDCGACVPVCPVSAIFALEDLPDKWKRYAEMNGVDPTSPTANKRPCHRGSNNMSLQSVLMFTTASNNWRRRLWQRLTSKRTRRPRRPPRRHLRRTTNSDWSISDQISLRCMACMTA
jgi:NAD-dependent dihydropyrimidine dehydrogenase PreA subunit